MTVTQVVDITKVFPSEILAEFATTLGIRPPDVGGTAASARSSTGYQLSELELKRLTVAFTKGLGGLTRFAANATQAAAGLTDGMHQVGAFLQRVAEKNPTLAARALKHVIVVAERHAKVGPGGQYV